MKKVILLAGAPATGKSYTSNIIKANHQTAMYIAQDEVIELLYDKIGFSCEQRKFQLIDYAREIYYQIVNQSLEENQIVMLDYPFSHKQIDFLDQLKADFNADFLTIRFVGDLDVLYDRRVERDLSGSRNNGHVLASYHGYESYTRTTYPLPREVYKRNCINGKYHLFEYGQTIEVDVTDYAQIDYVQLNKLVDKFLNKE